MAAASDDVTSCVIGTLDMGCKLVNDGAMLARANGPGCQAVDRLYERHPERFRTQPEQDQEGRLNWWGSLCIVLPSDVCALDAAQMLQSKDDYRVVDVLSSSTLIVCPRPRQPLATVAGGEDDGLDGELIPGKIISVASVHDKMNSPPPLVCRRSGMWFHFNHPRQYEYPAKHLQTLEQLFGTGSCQVYLVANIAPLGLVHVPSTAEQQQWFDAWDRKGEWNQAEEEAESGEKTPTGLSQVRTAFAALHLPPPQPLDDEMS